MKRFSVVALALTVVVLLVSATLVSAAGRGPVVTVGSEKVEEVELVRLIVDQAGAEEAMTPFVLAQLSMEDRSTFAQQVVTALLLSEAAKTKGINLDPAVASQVPWNVVNILAQAYISSVSAKWIWEGRFLKRGSPRISSSMQSLRLFTSGTYWCRPKPKQ